MHIKQITIFNFRSFQQQPDIQAFSPGTNSVVGRNGSGKSNLFDAVQFVLLAPRFYSLRQEERQALLHEGAGSAAVNAFVEVVFDNSDHRFALENSDEVVLRRTIGPKKDEFFLQRKRATKQEISSLLEGAGFSKSNPYFMIQQGKIQDICTQSEKERLALLKQVAGTTVYDEKKHESLTKMEENLQSIDKIRQILVDIETRLQELHGEKLELTNYQQLDRKRRAMEYTLYDKELRRARKNLDELEHDRVEHVEMVSKLHEEAKHTHDAIRNVEAVMKTKANGLKRNKKTLQELEADKTAAVKQLTTLKLECEELKESIRAGENQQKSNQKELQQLQGGIAKAQSELNDQVQPQYEEATTVLQQMTHGLDQNKRQTEGLHAKQGRGSHFQTKRERDDYLQSNIQEMNDTKTEKEASLTDLRQSLSNLRRSVTQETQEVEALELATTQKNEQQQTFSKTLDSKKRQRLEVHEKRQQQWRATEELTETVREARESWQKSQSDARKVMPRATAFGIDALEDIVRREGIVVGEQYFGMLMDNITLKDPKFQTAVEVAAQNALFHVIVDSDATAAHLMKRLEDGKLGRVTFLPLNRLHVEKVDYPANLPDIRPMLDLCVDFDPKVGRAIEHVFSKKLVARNIDCATTWSAKLGMDAITLEGDLSGRKGALTGGYVDSSKSRLRAHQNKKTARDAFQALEGDLRKSEQDAQKAEQDVANVSQEMQRLEAKNKEMQRLIKETERESDKKKKKIDKSKKQAEKVESKIAPLGLEIEGIDADIQRLQEEIRTELTSTLSAEEKQLIVTLKEAEKKLANDIEKQTQNVSSIGVERQRLQSLLEDNLMKRQQELQGLSLTAPDEDEEDGDFGARATFAAKVAQQKDELEEKILERDAADRVMHGIEERVSEARQSAEGIRTELIDTKGGLDKLKSTDANNKKALEEAQDDSDSLLNKRQMCVSKRETYATKIQELGALPPPSERESFANKSVSDLMKLLAGVAKSLKKYSHVNKKALDQYITFSEQRDSLLKRKDELDASATKVTELVESLDRQKDEAINRTFRGVSAHFKDVFKELVPLGEGELVMRTAIDDPESDEEVEAEDPASPEAQGKKKKGQDLNNPDVSLYRGVSVKVRFSPIGENFLMSQLSGGQKALVALALIFAIQRCDPAPFYIFDELDQALDSAYRASVANVIQKQANSAENPTQFIVSTFRPELVQVANQCYGISHQSKVSRFHHMTKKDALSFIADLMTEEETVGEVTSLSTTRASRRSSDSRKRKADAETKENDEEQAAADRDAEVAAASPGAGDDGDN